MIRCRWCAAFPNHTKFSDADVMVVVIDGSGAKRCSRSERGAVGREYRRVLLLHGVYKYKYLPNMVKVPCGEIVQQCTPR